MKLLQNSWSDMLVLDHIHQRLHNQLPDDTTLHNGQKFSLLSLGLLGVPSLADHFSELQNKLQELKFDVGDYICMKFLLLLNPGKEKFEGFYTTQYECEETFKLIVVFFQKLGALPTVKRSSKAMKTFKLLY